MSSGTHPSSKYSSKVETLSAFVPCSNCVKLGSPCRAKLTHKEQHANVSCLVQHEGYLLWRLRDTPGQSTLTAFPFQPVSRSAAITEACGKAHHRPVVATPDKGRVLPGQAGRLPLPDAEHGVGAAEHEPSAERVNEAEASFNMGEGQQMERHRHVIEETSRQHDSKTARYLPGNEPHQGLEIEAQAPYELPILQEEERLGSVGAAGRWAQAVQEEKDQGVAAEGAETVLDSSKTHKLSCLEEGGLKTKKKVHSSLERVADTGNEGWQSSLESPQPPPQLPRAQPAEAAQLRQAHVGNTADQQTRLEHMLPGKIICPDVSPHLEVVFWSRASRLY